MADDDTDLSQSLEARKAQHDLKEKGLCSLLRGCLYAFMGNLCLDKSLRGKFCMDYAGVLS